MSFDNSRENGMLGSILVNNKFVIEEVSLTVYSVLDPDLEISYLLSYHCRSFPKEGKRYCYHKKTNLHITVR